MCKMCDSIHILSPGILFVSSLVVGLRIAARLVHCPIYLSVLFALSYQRKKPFYAMIRDEHLFFFLAFFCVFALFPSNGRCHMQTGFPHKRNKHNKQTHVTNARK